jgi:hypothetical protein
MNSEVTLKLVLLAGDVGLGLAIEELADAIDPRRRRVETI